MRIIAGKYKGHHLVSFKADHIRPTTDRVKESLFNILSSSTDGASILDLFAGTGNLGIEALSRDAKSVHFVEKNKSSIEIIKRNLEKLKITEGYQITFKDVLSFLKSYNASLFDIIFVDPPFTEKMAHEVMLMASLAASQDRIFAPEAVLTIETGTRETIQESYPSLERYDVREFGDKALHFFRKVK
jgi:16S rRNA (guanine966-N2)-methyltransferase